MRFTLNAALRRLQRIRGERWCARVAEDADTVMRAIDKDLWKESRDYSAETVAMSHERLRGLPVSGGGIVDGRGGPAAFQLLYFLTRHAKPSTAVETGVAVGWSSRAIIDAMEANGKGYLFSIDLPMSRLPEMAGKEPLDEGDIGVMVDDRSRWVLRIGSDRDHLADVLAEAGTVDLFHYDSDKAYGGRAWAVGQVAPFLSERAWLVMDDVRDNLFFRDVSRRVGAGCFVVSKPALHSTKQRWAGVVSPDGSPLLLHETR